MASNSPSVCCITGFKHEGEALGEIVKVGTHDAYVAKPKKAGKYGIIIFPDFMGYELVNVKLIADQFAANGYLTVVPDLWEGDNVPLNWTPTSGFNLGAWMSKHGSAKTGPIAEAVIKALRSEYGITKLGGVGYCLGAKPVCTFMAKGKGIDAGYVAHPSATTADDVKGLAGPFTIAAAETDDLFPAQKRYETEAILKDMSIPYSISLYSDVDHGFALKADLSNPSIKFATETAFLQAVNWFDHYVKTG